MRTNTTEFSKYNNASSQEPVFVVEVAFDDAGTDVIYLTSHTVSGLTGEIFKAVLTDISGTTQKINPDKALSEIGALSFSALDDNLTAKQRTKLSAGLGLRGKRARFYAGFQGMDWSTYTLVQTQIIRSASYKDLVYSWKCSDIQREMRKSVFEVKSTALAKTLEPDDTEVEVYNTDGFQAVKQPPSPSGKTDAPGQKVGYVILEDDGKKEVIRYTGTTSTKFTGCTRGVLGTRPIRVEKSDDEGADNAPKVEEYVYLEMPAPMLAYAVLTGSIYDEPGETLPDHWHLGIAPQYIRTADYVGIGDDLWNLDNTDNGLAARIAGVKDEDGKQFVEEELFLLMGCYAPIYSNGEIGLRRMTGVLSGASSTRTLDRRNITGYGSLEHDMGSIINRMVIAWNWVDQREEYTRTNLLIDQFSIDTHGDADLKQLEFRALHGSRHSYNTLRSRFDALRDRYAGPPLRLSLDLMPDQNDLEVGDIVRVQLDEVEDYTGDTVGIDRAFEVQQVKVNWKTGAVAVELFGSSQPATPIPATQTGAVLPDEVYRAPGATEISASNFPGKVSSSGGITTIAGDISLPGSDDLRDASAIYYCMQDLTINAGATVTIDKNTQIRVKGFLQINGKIDGRGRGLQGGQGMNFLPVPSITNFTQKLASIFPSEKGYVGASVPAGGFYADYWQLRDATITENIAADNRLLGLNDSAPSVDLSILGSSVLGLPRTLCGQPGAGGGSVSVMAKVAQYARNPEVDSMLGEGLYRRHGSDQRYNKYWAAGGSGGQSGAGCFFLCSGSEIGASGVVDLSGGAGAYGENATPNLAHDGDIDAWHLKTLHAGRGAPGAPGCAYWAVLGSTSNPPTLTNSNALFGYGSNAFAPGTNPGGPLSAPGDSSTNYTALNNQTIDKPGLNIPGPGNHISEHVRIQFISGEIAPEPDVPEYSQKPAALTVTEALNTPKTPNANLSTLEVSVSAPADSAYSHALVEYRPQGDAGWTNAGPASPEALITVASDGTTYELRARSVSTSGLVSDDYVIGQITTTKIIGAEPGDPDVDDKIVIPAVRGMELEGQGNETEFSGRDAKFVWRATTIGQWFELGSEGQLGASASELDLYFRDYHVEIWAQNRVIRTEWVKDPAYVYTYEKNAEDYARENLAAGAWRSFEIRVYCRGRLNQLSKTPARLEATNHPPTNITGLAVTAGFNVIELVYKRPTDLDFAGVQVWVSETSGFNPDAVEPVATISDNSYVAGGLTQGKNYYVRLRPFDDFGIEGTTPTAEIMVTTRTGQDLGGLSGWAYEVNPVDRDFVNSNMEPGSINLTDNQVGGQLGSSKLANLAVIAEKLAGQAVTAEKIAALAVGTAAIQNLAVTDAKIKELSVAKLLAGVINATGPITTESILRAVDDLNNPSVQVGMGPTTLSVGGAQTSLLLWAVNNAGNVTFGVDELGNPYFKGTIEASGFENDNLSIDSLGNLISTGAFRFGGISEDYVEFNGTDLLIGTPFLKLDGTKAVFGDESTEQYMKYEGSVLQLGPKTSIGSSASRTVTVGPTGQFSSVNAALESLSRTVPAYKNGGFVATVDIQSAHVETESIHIVGLDLSWVTLTSSSPLSVNPATMTSSWMKVTRGLSPLIDLDINVITTGFPSLAYLIDARVGGVISIGASRTFDGTAAGGAGSVNTLIANHGGTIMGDSLTLRNCGTNLLGYSGSFFQLRDADISARYQAISFQNVTFDMPGTQVAMTESYGSVGTISGGSGNLSGSTFDCGGTGGSSSERSAFEVSGGLYDLGLLTMYNYPRKGMFVTGGKVDLSGASIRRVLGGAETSGVDADVNLRFGAIVTSTYSQFGANVAANAITGAGILFE